METCSVNQFECGSGECISVKFKCDGKQDCVDASDEEPGQCVCDRDMFKCNDGSCISMNLYCDLEKNCRDGSDEDRCGIYTN